MKPFSEVAGEALELTRADIVRYWKNPTRESLDGMNFALGLFSGHVMRLMSDTVTPPGAQTLKPVNDGEDLGGKG